MPTITTLDRGLALAETDEPAIAHIGLPSNQHGLCGSPTLGELAANPKKRCPACAQLWQQMSSWQRFTYRGQP